MEMVLFIGIQASGKSSFYRERFFRSHVRINGDMLKSRRREELLMRACLEGKTPFVIDKMNLTRAQRATYIAPAKRAGFKVSGYFFESKLGPALERNARRELAERVPPAGVGGASVTLQLPARDEGFDALYFVRLDGQGGFVVEAWQEAPATERCSA